jgi:hypothetical protein
MNGVVVPSSNGAPALPLVMGDHACLGDNAVSGSDALAAKT